MSAEYLSFLEGKIVLAEKHGIKIDPSLLHPSTKPHQLDTIVWGLERGAALMAPDCGQGKTHDAIEMMRMLHHYNGGGKYLVVTELGATETFAHPDPSVGEGARLGVQIDYVTNQREAMISPCFLVVTNYERVRMGEFDFGAFDGVVLDEGNYLKNMASETTNALNRQLKKVKFKYIFTATPNPNECLELVNYSHVLGIADRGQILTRFFQRNSTKAGELTLHPQHAQDFWMWVHSWMITYEKPSDLGHDDNGYELPELIVTWHEVKLDKTLEGNTTRDGQKEMFIAGGNSLPDNAKIKRESIDVRLKAALAKISENPDDHYIIWHHLEDERKALDAAFKGHPSYQSLYGSQHWAIKEDIIVSFSKGQLQILGTKDSLTGVGCNFQKYCHRNIVLGINNDWDALYQLMKRTHRPYGMGLPVYVDIYYTPEEYAIVNNLKRKWSEHIEQRAIQREITKTYGLSHNGFVEEKRRSFKTNRREWKGKNFHLVNNDAILEYQNLPDDLFDMHFSSFPFGTHYEYTDKYNDLGHNSDNKQFIKQLDFFLPHWYRTLKPGRIAAVDLKNRIHYGSVTGKGFSVMHRFTHLVCDAMEKHGFECMGFHYIPTDVVAENNQTYRLTFGEMQKDSTKMGAGIPEEIWIFRKPPTTTDNAYADEPVTHNQTKCPCCGHKGEVDAFFKKGAMIGNCRKCGQFFAKQDLIVSPNYSLAHWQVDADAFWKSSGNRYLTAEEIAGWGIDKLQAWWKRFNSENIYDYEKHVEFLQLLDEKKKLSRTFTTLPLRSNTPYIWNDVNRMQGLNLQQRLRKKQNHICPMPFDKADRIIELYSEPGEYIDDPFNGLGTTGMRALLKRRRYFGTELSDFYSEQSAIYLRETEGKMKLPTLFDLQETAA